jgi:hypothetical protein
MSNRLFRRITGGLALVSLSEETYKKAFLLASIAWFILATARAMSGKNGPSED